MGNRLPNIRLNRLSLKKQVIQPLDGKKLWFDDKFGQLNTDEKGEYLGSLKQKIRYWLFIMMVIMK